MNNDKYFININSDQFSDKISRTINNEQNVAIIEQYQSTASISNTSQEGWVDKAKILTDQEFIAYLKSKK